MRYGIYVPCFGEYGDPEVLCDLAVSAEESGWDGFFTWDHVAAEPPLADPWVTMGAMAMRTSRIMMGPMIVAVPRRRPQKLAAEASTLQRLSGGRLIVGVGAGILPDFTSYGEPTTAKVRSAKLVEGVSVMRSLLSGEPVEHEGTHYRVTGVRFAPVDVPIWVSGAWPKEGRREKAFLAAEDAAGAFPVVMDPEHGTAMPTPEQAADMKTLLLASGARPNADLAIWYGRRELDADEVRQYENAGVTWMFSVGWGEPLADVRQFVADGPPLVRR